MQNLQSVKNSYIPISEIIWPYRPDILIRIDFLEWFSKNQNKYFEKRTSKLSEDNIKNNKQFFSDAKKHPYFLQYTRKRRYRRYNLSREKSEKIYTQGIVAFVNLVESIEKKGFDKKNKIGLYKTILLKKPRYGEKIKRDFYMGDGCHRLASLIWLEKKNELPKEFLHIQSKLIFRPVNSFGIFKKLKIFTSSDEKSFFHLFNGKAKPDYDEIINWTEKIRIRFKEQNVNELLKIKFSN